MIIEKKERIEMIIWISLMILVRISHEQTTLYVSPNGSGTNCTFNSSCSLTQAIDLASNGDIISLLNGTYEITNKISFS